tara:strand:+ start:4536 stop:4955 length:420 start_codon:yes stop_codon:yes gene_type:complete
MSETKIIIKQVALKGAVELCKNSFSVESDIKTQADTVTNIASYFNDWLLNGYEDPAIIAVESAGMKAEVKSSTGNNNEASDAQKKFVRDLFVELPEEEKAKYADFVNAQSMTWQFASEHIPMFQEIIKKAKDNSGKAPF